MDEEGSKVRLVRCPKCGNLLPELPNFSVYQCGGCGAVLRAKSKGISEEGVSEVSDDEKGRGVMSMNSGNAFETERESNGIERGRAKEMNEGEREVSNGSSMSRIGKKEVSVDSDWPRHGGEKIDPVIDHGRRVDRRQNLKGPIDNFVGGEDRALHMGTTRHKYANPNIGYEDDEIRHPVRSARPGSVADDWTMERNGSVLSRGSDRGDVRPGRFSKFPYVDEGPSNYGRGRYDGYGERTRYHDSIDGLARVANLEHDRAELLKKLDELKDEISKSSDMPEKPIGPPTPPDPYARRDKHIPRPPYLAHSYSHAPYMDPPDSVLQDSYHPRNFINEHPGYNDAYYPQMPRRPPNEPPLHYSRQTYQEHFPDYYMNYDQDPFMSHPPETFFHRPTCTCMYCYNMQGPSNIHPRGFTNPNSRNGPPSAVAYHHLNAVGPKGYVSDGSYPHHHSRDRQTLTRTPSDLDSENGGFSRRRPREAVITKGRARVCYPIAGGAPFIVCSHCFELLRIPRKLLLLGNSRRKLRCGACSSTILFDYGTKGIVIAVSEENKHVSDDISDFPEIENDNLQSDRDWLQTETLNLESPQPNLASSKDQKLDSSDLENKRYPRFSSSSFSEDEQSPDSVIVRENVTHLDELLQKDDVSSPIPDHSQSNDVMNRDDKFYKTKNPSEERGILEKITSRSSSIKEAPKETEMDVSVNEFPNSGVSQDSTEMSSEGASRINKLAGFIKNNIINKRKDFSRPSQSMENEKFNVFINRQPIPDRVLKKVEKVAGPIQPGDYWYDYTAGFWGVMGHPCLGIIPPKIEEFNFPLPEDCANGSTKVFVNGRELHQTDLDLLSSRGLPLARHKSYLVEMSGKVVDEHTGDELDNLGKLAPTVERAGHGFGMKIPKSIAQQGR